MSDRHSIAAVRLRVAIKHSKLSEPQIARQLGISEKYLSDLACGKVGVSAFVAVRLERVLGIDAHRMLVDQTLEELKQARSEYVPTREKEMA